jgi:inner membrane protein
MDIISHTLSGVATVSVVLPFTNFTKRQSLVALILGAFVGAFPDLDALSLWSGFGQKGSDIYFGKYWFSHHAFNHSLVVGFILAAVMVLLRNKFDTFIKDDYLLTMALFFAFTAHLLEDMPTPYCTWGGVRLFFPFKSYVGGWGKIWWWNNYDLFLLICGLIVSNLLAMVLLPKMAKMLVVMFFGSTLFLMIHQINSRQTDYNYIGYSKNYQVLEKASLVEQERVLGPTLFKCMRKLDDHIPLNF